MKHSMPIRLALALMLLYITFNLGETDRYEIGLMAPLRIDGARGRLARCVGIAALAALLSTAGALAEKPASASHSGDDAKSTAANAGGESRHPGPPAGASQTGAQHHFGPRPDTRGARVDKVDKPREGHNDLATRPGLQRGSKPGQTSLDKLDVSVPRLLPKGNARDRLFKKIEAVKLAPLRLPRPAGPISPTGPARNAIGVVPADARGSATHLAAIPANPGRGPIGLPNPARNSVHVPLGQTVVPTSPRGLINGTTMRHVGSGPGTLGGPARAVTGINGTTFKPKY